MKKLAVLLRSDTPEPEQRIPMKTSTSTPGRLEHAFSLMELLVVITIILILSAILLPAGHTVTKTMRKVEAQKTASELRTGMVNYFSEYKRFPNISGGSSGGDTVIQTDGSTGLLTALLGIGGSASTQSINPRGTQFFSAKTAKSDGRKGIWASGGSHKLYDPWGGYYFVQYDSDYSNAMTVPSRTGSGTEEIYSSVAVWSYGENGELGGPSGKRNDDVYSYQ